MWLLHVLAVLSALVFGGTFSSSPGGTPVAGWQVALAFFGGALVPYFVVFSWAFLVAPPDLREIFRRKAHLVASPETIEIDDEGVARMVGSINERIRWGDVEEIRIITTDGGPYAEDVFFAILDGENKGCLVPHDAAVKFKLLERLQSRFHGLDDAAVIRAMGSTSNSNFLIWKRQQRANV